MQRRIKNYQTSTLNFFIVALLLAMLPGLSLGQKNEQFKTNGKPFEHIRRSQDIEKNQLCLPSQWRRIDGTCNNRSASNRSEWGASDVQLFRSMTPQYAISDPFNNMAGQNRLSPRAISNYVCAQNGDIPSKFGLSSFVFTWGQFVDHDIDLTPEGHTEYYPIALPNDEQLFTDAIPFFRSAVHTDTGDDEAREQTNLITSWLDASNVYGSESGRADWLRTFGNGKLKMSAGQLLPYNTIDGEYASALDPDAPSMAGDNGGQTKIFVAGDIRAAEQPGLTSLHTLFVREHNRICDRLRREGMRGDEEIYQTARKKVGALIQAITFKEFLPALGITLDPYNGYRAQVKPDISNLFATAAYRLGHTMVTEELLLKDNRCRDIDGGSISLADAFFNPTVLPTYGIEAIFRGLAVQTQQEIDVFIIDNLRNFLFVVPGAGAFGLDLASLNIQRGRDHGLPDYNTVRAEYTGNGVSNFAQINSDPAIQTALIQAYQGDIDDIDAWVGLLAERTLPGKSMGPTLHAILKKQFQALRDGDYFYYEYDPYLDREDRRDVNETRLAEVIERNTDINDLQRNVFFADECTDDSTVGGGGSGGGGNGGNNGGGGNGGNNGGGGNGGNNGGGGNGLRNADAGSALDVVQHLEIHPNPTNGAFTIDYNIVQAGAVTLQVIQASGSVVYEDVSQRYTGTHNVRIDLNNAVKGFYLVMVQTPSGNLVKKLVVH